MNLELTGKARVLRVGCGEIEGGGEWAKATVVEEQGTDPTAPYVGLAAAELNIVGPDGKQSAAVGREIQAAFLASYAGEPVSMDLAFRHVPGADKAGRAIVKAAITGLSVPARAAK